MFANLQETSFVVLDFLYEKMPILHFLTCPKLVYCCHTEIQINKRHGEFIGPTTSWIHKIPFALSLPFNNLKLFQTLQTILLHCK